MVRLIAALSLAIAPVLGAQTIAGTWKATFDADISMQRDTFVVKSRRPATLTLTRKGDSVTGTWAMEGMPVRPVSGTFDGRVLQLTTGTNELEIRVDGKPQKAQVRSDWTATLSGNRLAGTMFIRMGDREPPPRRWEAEKK